MNILQTLKEKLAPIDEEKLLKEMGYHNLAKAKERLHSLLEAADLEAWLESGAYDFLYSSRGFLRRLFEILELPSQPLEEEFRRIDAKKEALAKMQAPYIFADTNFRRRNEPIFVLAFLECKRRIPLDKRDVAEMPLPQVLSKVSQIVRRHYEQSGGKLTVWGPIHRYVYHHTDGSTFVFDHEGNLLTDSEPVEESRAELTLKGKPIDIVFGEKKENDS